MPAAAARAKTVVSNATRWDTFEGLMPKRELPKSEQLFRARYKKSPSFLSIHLGVRADVFGPVRGTWGVICCCQGAGLAQCSFAPPAVIIE